MRSRFVLLSCAVVAWSMPWPSSSQGWTSGLQPAATGELSEIPIADLLDDDSDILIVEPGSGGISHIKAPSSFELALVQHASAKPGAVSESAVVDALQAQLDRLEPGALVDKSSHKAAIACSMLWPRLVCFKIAPAVWASEI